MHRQFPDALRHCRVLAGDRTTITSSAKVLGGEKAEAASITPATDWATSPTGPGGLCAVLDYQQLMTPGNGGQLLHVHRPAKQMHRHQRPSGGRNRRLHLLKIDQVGLGIDIHKHWFCANRADGFGCGKKAEGAGDDLITRANTEAPERQDQCISAAVAADGMFAAAEAGKSFFKPLDDRAPDVLAAAQDIQHSLLEVFPQI